MVKLIGKKEKQKGRPSKYTADQWIAIRGKFVQGVPDEAGNRKFPTIEVLAKEYNIPANTVYNHSADELWLDQRATFQTKLQNELDDERRKQLVKQSIDFDSSSLTLARAIQNEITMLLRQAQDERKEALSAAKAKDRRVKPFTASSLNSLSMALSIAQRVGRLALGETTENTNVSGTIDNRTQVDEALSIVRDIARAKSGFDNILH